MAEYIDKNMINERMLEYAVISGLNHHKMSAFILNIPTADVIERSKIDKAMEEIKQEIQNGTIKITSGNEKLFNILENIGE